MPNRRTILKMLVSLAIWPLGCVQNEKGTSETQSEKKEIKPSGGSDEAKQTKPTGAQRAVEKRELVIHRLLLI